MTPGSFSLQWKRPSIDTPPTSVIHNPFDQKSFVLIDRPRERDKIKGQTVQTGENLQASKQTDGQMDARTLPKVLSPLQ